MRNIDKWKTLKSENCLREDGFGIDTEKLFDWGNRVDALMDEVFIHDPKNKTLTINSSYPYEIDLCRIKSQTALISWTLHLADKKWMPKEFLCEFIERVSKIKGWRCHV